LKDHGYTLTATIVITITTTITSTDRVTPAGITNHEVGALGYIRGQPRLIVLMEFLLCEIEMPGNKHGLGHDSSMEFALMRRKFDLAFL